jgi:hypothetical protein
MPLQRKIYPGLDEDSYAGMTPTGHIVRDAQVFGLIEEDETCVGWSIAAIQDLYDKVTDAWRPYGHMVSNLPEDLRERHRRIYDDALTKAKARGWGPELYPD